MPAFADGAASGSGGHAWVSLRECGTLPPLPHCLVAPSLLRRRPKIAELFLATALCLSSRATRAQAPQTPSALTLGQATRLGVERNLSTLEENLQRRSKLELRRAAYQPYSPTVRLNADLVHSLPERRGTSELAYLAEVDWHAPWGTTLTAQALATQGLAGYSGSDGQLSLSVTQPLLKGGWLTGAALPLREAELNAALQRELYRQSLNQLLLDVQTAYWDLAVANADVVIKTRSRERAKQQYDDTQENIRRGILAEGEIYVVEENVVFFDQELVSAAQTARNAQRQLALLLALPESAPLTTTDELRPTSVPLASQDEVTTAALSNHPKILAQRVRTTLAQVRERYASNQRLPALDAIASASNQGSDSRLGPALGKSLSSGPPTTTVGVAFTLPLDQGAEKAKLASARLDLDREALELQNTERQVSFDAARERSDLEVNLRQLTLAQRAVKLAELKLDAQVDKYKMGISTLADVVRFQRDLDNANSRLQHTLRTVNVGQVRLLASEGTLADALGVRVE